MHRYRETVDHSSSPGYLRILGATFTAEVFKLPLVLGRQSKHHHELSEEESFLALGDSKTLSRKHACVQWDAQNNTYVIQCLSKNGLVLNQKLVTPDDGFVKLPDRARIEIADTPFYVVYPIEIVQQ
jgi:hypothetical protein